MTLQLWSETARKICKNAAGKLFRFSEDCCVCDCPTACNEAACGVPKVAMENNNCADGIFICGFSERDTVAVGTVTCTYLASVNVGGKVSSVTISCAPDGYADAGKWILTAFCSYAGIAESYQYPEPIPGTGLHCCFPHGEYRLERIDGSDCQDDVTVHISYA